MCESITREAERKWGKNTPSFPETTQWVSGWGANAGEEVYAQQPSFDTSSMDH